MSEAISGPGFLLQLGSTTGDAGSYTTIAEVKDISGPGITLDTIDVTNQDSPNKFEEIIPSIRRGGEVDFDCHFLPNHQTHDENTGLIYLANGAIKRGYRLQTQDGHGTYWAFDGYVVNFMPKTPVVGVMVATVKIKVTGKPTLVNGTS